MMVEGRSNENWSARLSRRAIAPSESSPASVNDKSLGTCRHHIDLLRVQVKVSISIV